MVVNGNSVTLAAINEDTSPAGQTVSALVASHFSDADGALRGIAISGNGSSAAQGQWQYFNGTSWVDIGLVSEFERPAAQCRRGDPLLSAANFNGAAPTLTVHLIDASVTFTNGSSQNLLFTSHFSDADAALRGSTLRQRLHSGARSVPVLNDRWW